MVVIAGEAGYRVKDGRIMTNNPVCGVTPVNGGILLAAKMVTCPPYVGIV